MTRPSSSPQTRRAGFTLVELLVVIVIIGILMGLLIPAIMGAIHTANNARVVAEINNMASALEQFKSQYGDYPPSRIILSESGSYQTAVNSSIASQASSFLGTDSTNTNKYASNDLTFGQLCQRSVQYLRKFFPKAAPATTAAWHDFNGFKIGSSIDNGPDPGYIYLEGHECLVFFLGGIPNHTSSTTIGMSGFGRNPLYPFTNQIVGSAVYSDARKAPFYQFQANRLIDRDGDGIPGYVDTLNTETEAQFYAYFSAYGNNMYDPNDVNLDSSMGQTFNVKVGVAGNSEVSPSPNPYCSDNPSPTSQFPTFINQTTFQIISAGADAVYGPGGQYVPDSNLASLPTAQQGSGTASQDQRLFENDNLTNFATSRLD